MDLDRDGRSDIISGSWPGELYFFRRLGDGSFAKPRTLRHADGEVINAGAVSTAFAVDWDGDYDLDLLVGAADHKVYLLLNEGDINRVVFGKQRELISLRRRGIGDTHPVAADWDGDGRLDLVIGHGEGGVLWSRNTGSPAAPKFGEPVELIPKGPTGWRDDSDRRPNDWGVRSRICVTDWNRDGRPDILLGDHCGRFKAKPEQTPEEQFAEREAVARLSAAQTAWVAAFREYRELLGAKSAEEQRRAAALLTKIQRLKTEIAAAQQTQLRFQPQWQAHGFVWLFLHKGPPE